MDKEHLGFPFSAVMNADSAKLAIKCMLVSPHIRTLLIQGVSGSAKTTLVRSIPNISDMTVVNMPLNTSEGQVIGSLDIERTIVTGERRVLPGLLEKADNGILYGDDCNLMDATILDTVLKAAADGTVMAERDGMSWSFDADVKFIGTANIAESQVNGHLMDMFDMCVTIPQTDNENDRYEIVRRKTEFDRDPKTFRSRFQSEDDDIASSVTAAMERVPFVTISDDLLKVIAELSCKLGVEGHRGDISLTNASKAVAALNGRDDVTLDDIKSVAGMCLGHRMTDMPDENTSSEQGQEQSGNERPEMSPSDDDGHDGERTEGDREQGVGDGDKETVFSIGNAFSVIDFTEMAMQRNQRTMKGYGKHGTMGKGDKRGRYVRSRISSQRSDIAIDASIRAAAPYQRFRKKDGMALVLEPEDLRQKVRERKSGASVMFLVDASGSMGARKRMVAVKGAVFSLLQESYRNRDKVGLTAFRKDSAEVLLPFTKSVDFAYRKLKELPTGGTTPLASALLKAYTEVKKEMRSKPHERYYIVLTTDGRANVPMNGGDAFNDSLNVAKHIGNDDTMTWIVVDTGTGFPHTDNALKICGGLNGTYLKLEDLNADGLAHRIKTIVNRRS